METVGNDGVITVEESQDHETTGMTTAEGMQFDRGYASAYMVTDTDKMEAVLDNPLILITDKKIPQHSGAAAPAGAGGAVRARSC